MVRLAFRSRQSASTSELATLKSTLAGEAGPVGEEELNLLAAATLAVILSKADSSAALAATLIRTTHLGGLRVVTQPMDLIGMATNTMRSISDTSRRRQVLKTASSATINFAPVEALEAVKTFDQEHIEKAFVGLVQSTKLVLQTLAKQQLQYEQAVSSYVRIQDEELDMLWWLHGSSSFSMSIPFSEIPALSRPLVLAKELADMTATLPGPLGIQALLSRAGVAADVPVNVQESVQNLAIEWLRTALPEANSPNVSPVTTPIHEAMKRRAEVHGDDSWMGVWASVCDVKSDERLCALSFAELAYYERLLIHGG
nr:GTPase-associated system all-helical protein GASH [Rhodanobacter sp. MP1X3]